MAKNQSTHQIELQIAVLKKKIELGVNGKQFYSIVGKINKLTKQIKKNSWEDYLSK